VAIEDIASFLTMIPNYRGGIVEDTVRTGGIDLTSSLS
jgi:hypothetical protein